VINSKAFTLLVRPYLDDDEAEVLELLTASLGGGPAGRRPAEFFRWKHLASPFGRSVMLVAASDGRIVGLRAFLRWRFRVGDRTVEAVRAVDTVTDPEFRGRGVFSTLTRAGLKEVRGNTGFVFNTPNEKSLPGYLKMGWQIVGRVPVSVRVRRPVSFVRHLAGSRAGRAAPAVHASPAAKVLGESGVADLLERAETWEGFATPRTQEYLRWRYAEAPLLDYRAVAARDEGRIGGLALFRVRPRGRMWETTVAEIIVPAGDGRTAGRLLRAVVGAAAVDHLTCSFPPSSAAARATRRMGFLRSPRGVTLVVNPLAPDLAPDPSELGSWALSLGDLEVF
jgi:GNAT superfamily N-acetyltransferase